VCRISFEGRKRGNWSDQMYRERCVFPNSTVFVEISDFFMISNGIVGGNLEFFSYFF
jgi:hypothetical protein